MKNIKKSPEETLLCILEAIDRKNKLTPEPSLEEKKIKRLAMEKLKRAEEGITEDWYSAEEKRFALLEDKKIKISLVDVKDCNIVSVFDLKNVLGVLKQRKFISGFYIGPKNHNYFDVALSKNFRKQFDLFENGIQAKEEISCRAEYNKGILSIAGKKINFNNANNQKDLLDILFQRPNKKWEYLDIQTAWEENLEYTVAEESSTENRNYWRRFYNASRDISDKIAKKTLISDFFISDEATKDIRINPNYV